MVRYVTYHSHDWELMLLVRERTNTGVFGWCTWSVENGVAEMRWTQF